MFVVMDEEKEQGNSEAFIQAELGLHVREGSALPLNS